jgi:hypothetical protein
VTIRPLVEGEQPEVAVDDRDGAVAEQCHPVAERVDAGPTVQLLCQRGVHLLGVLEDVALVGQREPGDHLGERPRGDPLGHREHDRSLGHVAGGPAGRLGVEHEQRGCSGDGELGHHLRRELLLGGHHGDPGQVPARLIEVAQRVAPVHGPGQVVTEQHV